MQPLLGRDWGSIGDSIDCCGHLRFLFENTLEDKVAGQVLKPAYLHEARLVSPMGALLASVKLELFSESIHTITMSN